MRILSRQHRFSNNANKESDARPRRQFNPASAPVIQAKLTVGMPNDRYEREADYLADRVMRITDRDIGTNNVSTLRRKSLCRGRCDEEDGRIRAKPLVQSVTPLIQRQLMADEAGHLHFKSTATQVPQVTPRIESGINSLKGGGQPLSESTRAFFEPRFGQDFTGVRVHTGDQAAKTADAVNARAFTNGKDIVFNSNQYAPQSTSGKHLLAHELSHTIQQKHSTAALATLIQRLSDPLSDMDTFQSPGGSGWRGAIFGCYRNNCSKSHEGWDIHASVGTQCKAVVAGTISHNTQADGAGEYVNLTSSANSTKVYQYFHLDTWESDGTVAEGDKIGTVGTTGNAQADRPHLHFGVKEDGTKVDPDGKGFTKPTKVIEASGSSKTTINYSEAEPCSPC